MSESLRTVTTNNDNYSCRLLGNYYVADTELGAALTCFFDVPNTPLKVDPKARQTLIFFFFTLMHLSVCLSVWVVIVITDRVLYTQSLYNPGSLELTASACQIL